MEGEPWSKLGYTRLSSKVNGKRVSYSSHHFPLPNSHKPPGGSGTITSRQNSSSILELSILLLRFPIRMKKRARNSHKSKKLITNRKVGFELLTRSSHHTSPFSVCLFFFFSHVLISFSFHSISHIHKVKKQWPSSTQVCPPSSNSSKVHR